MYAVNITLICEMCLSRNAAVRPVWYDYEGVYRIVKDLENLILKPMNKLYRTHQLTPPKIFADRLADSQLRCREESKPARYRVQCRVYMFHQFCLKFDEAIIPPLSGLENSTTILWASVWWKICSVIQSIGGALPILCWMFLTINSLAQNNCCTRH